MRSRTVLLQGEPGSGKSKMAATTPRGPVHYVDVDRKILSAGWAVPMLATNEISVWELAEAIDDTNIKSRIGGLVKREKPAIMPKGWLKFADYIQQELWASPEGKAAQTIVIDSLTLLNEHLKTHIMYLADKSKFTFDQWAALKVGWMDTLSVLRDLCREHDKDLILTVHERTKEEPGERVRGVQQQMVKIGNDLEIRNVYEGTQDVKVWASIDGAFGDLIGAQCDEYYWLHVVMENGEPKWRCRVKPDGKRSLRTSFNVTGHTFNPDFKEIWK